MSPEHDLALIKVGESLCMLAIDALLKDTLLGLWTFGELLEISSYHNDDILHGLLIRCSIKGVEGNEKEFEVFVRRKVNFVHKDIEFRKGEFEVGTNFDVKEKLFRNFLNAMNENSEPVLVYSFKGTEAKNDQEFIMKVSWMDPKGDVAYVTEKSITNSSVDKQIIAPKLSVPLMSGIWTIIVLNEQNKQLFGRLQFLVSPTQNILEDNPVLYNVSSKELLNLQKIAHKTQTKSEKKLLALNRNLLSDANI